MRAIDLFSGGGGSSWGARLAGVNVVGAFDLWPTAKSVYEDNFPDTDFFGGRIENRSATELRQRIGKIDLIIASPECTNHGPAKGAKKRCEKSRETAFQVTRFAKAFLPRWVVIENVVGMKSWSRYGELIDRFKSLEYHVSEQTVNAADCGVPQNRRRLFVLCDRKKAPPLLQFDCGVTRTAAEIIDRDAEYGFSPLRTKERAEATLVRAENAMAELGTKRAFLLVYYGSDQAGGWQSLDVPLRTLTTLDRFALVKPTAKGHLMRMLQVPELKAAMGMPKRFAIRHGSRRDKIRVVGNAVCPPVMRAVIRTLTAKR